MYSVTIFIAFKQPDINLTCATDYTTSKKSVHATWIPESHLSPEEALNRIQNCGATVICDNGYNNKVQLGNFH